MHQDFFILTLTLWYLQVFCAFALILVSGVFLMKHPGQTTPLTLSSFAFFHTDGVRHGPIL